MKEQSFHMLLEGGKGLVSAITIEQRNCSGNVKRSLSELGRKQWITMQPFSIQTLPGFRNLPHNMLLCGIKGRAWMLLHVVFYVRPITPLLILILWTMSLIHSYHLY